MTIEINLRNIYENVLARSASSEKKAVNNQIAEELDLREERSIYDEYDLNELFSDNPMDLVRAFVQYGKNSETNKTRIDDYYQFDDSGAINSFNEDDLTAKCLDTIIDCNDDELLNCEAFIDFIAEDLKNELNNLSLPEELDKVLDENNITLNIYSEDNSNLSTIHCEFEFYSDLGEDVFETFDLELEDIVDDDFASAFVNGFCEHSECFDADEHAQMHIEYRGKHGVPNSIRDLIDDADNIKKTLENVSAELKEAYNLFVSKQQKNDKSLKR